MTIHLVIAYHLKNMMKEYIQKYGALEQLGL